MSEDQCIFGIIGNPIKQTKSPAVFGEYFRLHRINAVMVPLHVGDGDFQNVLKGLRGIKNFGGAVITIPYKYDAYAISHKKGPMALATGTANVLTPVGKHQWSAEMLDGIGLINALRKRNIVTDGMRALILGAGGAGTAIAVALEKLGRVSFIGIFDTDTKRADDLVVKLTHAEKVRVDARDYQLIVNASPVGMGSNETPLTVPVFAPGCIVCDVVMQPPKTRFLREAVQKGCVIVEGLEMLRGQVEPIVRFLGLQGTVV